MVHLIQIINIKLLEIRKSIIRLFRSLVVTEVLLDLNGGHIIYHIQVNSTLKASLQFKARRLKRAFFIGGLDIANLIKKENLDKGIYNQP